MFLSSSNYKWRAKYLVIFIADRFLETEEVMEYKIRTKSLVTLHDGGVV